MRSGRVICMFCEERFKYFKQFHQHLIVKHETIIITEKKTFCEEEEFLRWKTSEEDGTNCLFVKDTSGKKLKDGSTALYYYCHRSFNERAHTKSNTNGDDSIPSKKKTKRAGSNKIGLSCPALMKAVILSNQTVEVEYCSTHIGHDCELGRMPLREENRIMLAGRLGIGVSIETILRDIRKSANGNVERRIDLLTRDDLHNTKRSFNLDGNVRKRCDDATSVKSWTEEMATLKDDNPVLLYTPLSTDTDRFMLIIMTPFQKNMLKKFGAKNILIDGTNETNEYKFQLYTLLVVDELNEGIPVAFCFSNREDADTFETFFSEVEKAIGKCIDTEVFVSDGASHINTNMHLEALHRAIKVDYLNGKKNIRLDMTINALIDLVREKKFERLIKMEKKKAPRKKNCIRISHEASKEYLDKISVKNYDRVWIVGDKYEVSRHDWSNYSDISSCCALKCDICNICVHNYTCSCPDNAIKFNLCKHIHAVVMSCTIPTQIITVPSFQLPEEVDDPSLHDENLSPEYVFSANLENVTVLENKDLEIRAKAELLLGYTQTRSLDDENSEKALQLFNKLISLYKGEKRSLPSLPKGVKRTNFTPQENFPVRFPKKRKKVIPM